MQFAQNRNLEGNSNVGHVIAPYLEGFKNHKVSITILSREHYLLGAFGAIVAPPCGRHQGVGDVDGSDAAGRYIEELKIN